MATAAGVSPAAKPVVSEVRAFEGVPALWIDGMPVTGLMHWNRSLSEADIGIFREAGIHLYSIMGAPPTGEGNPSVVELTPEYLDRMFAMIERTDPTAKVLVRYTPKPSEKWMAEHPDDLVRNYDIGVGCWAQTKIVSPSSVDWRAKCAAAIVGTTRYIEKKWGHLVFGYHPGLGCCGENAYAWGYGIADYSAVQLRRWDRRRPDVPPPSPESYLARRPFDDTRRLLDPVKDEVAVDFMRFQSETMADAVTFIARTVKDELRRLGRRKVCGVFYGYMSFPVNQTDLFVSGHQDHQTVLNCPDIDFIAAPIDYAGRPAGCSAIAQVLAGSIAAHGKLYYAEEDTRFHTARTVPDRVTDDPDVSREVLLRNFFDTWSHGGSCWWMDLHGTGWYRDRALVPTLSDCCGFAERHLALRRSVAQIAVFASDRSVAYERIAPRPLSNELVALELPEIAACGAPYDVFRLEDVPLLAKEGCLAPYRMAVVLNAHAVDDGLRTELRRSLFRDGRTVVFLGASGYIRGASSDERNATDLTGIGLVEVESRHGSTVEAFPEGRRIMFGSAQKEDPLLVVGDPEATPLGWFVQGSERVRPGSALGVALAEKRLDGWTSVVCTVPSLPSDQIRALASAAGVHIWSAHGDQVLAGENWFVVAAKMPGRHVIRLPRKAEVKGVLGTDGRFGPCESFEIDIPRGGFRAFEFLPR